MAQNPKRRRRTFFGRGLVIYNPWPEIAGQNYDRDSMVDSVDRLCDCLVDYCGTKPLSHDNVKAEEFPKRMEDFIKTCYDHDAKIAFVYICTHGVVHDDGELYLMMDDSSDPEKDLDGFLRSSITGQELAGYIRKLTEVMSDRKVIVFLECCQAGALADMLDFSKPETLGHDLDDRQRVHPSQKGINAPIISVAGATEHGVAVFLSSQENEKSYVGVFTDSIVKCMTQMEKNIEVEDLSTMVKEDVRRKTSDSKIYTHGSQTPRFVFHPSSKTVGIIGVNPGNHSSNQEEPMEVDERDDLGGILPSSWHADLGKLQTKANEAIKVLETVKLSADLDSTSNKIEELKKRGSEMTFAETKILFAGETGCGKSTLINALVDAKVLPMTAAGKGCTATILEIKCSEEDGQYQAKVFFFCNEEWKKQEKDLKRRAVNDAEIKSELDILASVEDEINQFLKEGMKEISAKDHDDLLEQLTRYCSSGVAGKPSFWRIVKRIEVFLPSKMDFLKNVVLLDIPGFNDSNRTRENLAWEKFQEAEVVWILADTKRALDSATLSDLMKDLEENYGCNQPKTKEISFVLTHGDDNMDIDSYLCEVDEHSEEGKELKRFKNMIKQEKDKKKKKSMRQELKVNCIKHRNDQCKKSFEGKLASNYKDTKHLKTAPVYIVSGGDYLKQMDDDYSVFENEEDTKIPELRKQIDRVAEKYRCEKIKEFLKDVWILAAHVKKECVEKEQPDLINHTMKEKLSSSFGKWEQDVVENIGEIIEEIRKSVTNCVNKDFSKRHADYVIEKWKKLQHKTKGAVIIRGGYFEQKKGGKIDFCRDVMENCINWSDNCGKVVESLQNELKTFCKNWIEEETVVSLLAGLRETLPNSAISAEVLLDMGSKQLKHLRLDFEKFHAKVAKLIKGEVESKIRGLCQEHSKKNPSNAIGYIGYGLKKCLPDLKERAMREVNKECGYIKSGCQSELERYRQSVLDLVIAATTADNGQENPGAPSNTRIADEFMKTITKLFQED